MSHNHANKAFAVTVVALLMTVAIAAPVLYDESSADSEPYTSPYANMIEDPEYGFVFLVPVGYALWQLVAAAAITGVVGFSIGYFANEFTDGVGDNEEYFKQLRQQKVEDLVAMSDLLINAFGSLLPADADLWSFTGAYWNRAVELIVAEVWGEGVEYDPNGIIDRSLLRANLQNYLYDWQSTVDKGFNTILDTRMEFTGECWDDVVQSIEWAGGSITASADGNIPFTFDLNQAVTAGMRGQTVYIDADTWDAGGEYRADTSGTIYNLGTSTVTMTKMKVFGSDTAGKVITIAPGASHTLSSTDSGLWSFNTNNSFIAGPLSKAAFKDAADVIGSLVLNSGDRIVYALPSGDNLTIGDAGSSSKVTSNYLRIVYDYTGTNKTTGFRDISGSGTYLVRDWNDMIQRINEIIDKASTAGETIWGIFDATEESNSFLSPSSINMTVKGLGLSTAEQQAIYIQALSRVAEYWDTNGAELKGMEFNIDAASSDLIVYGDIYHNGTLWMNNAVFTPYLAVTEDQEITVGERSGWSGPGFAMVWDQVDVFSQWDGSKSTSTHYLLSMDSGYSIEAKKILKGGNEVDSITLAPTIIERYSTDPSGLPDNPEPVKVLDGSTMILIIFMELAIIVFLLGYMWGQPLAGAIIAIIVLVIGLTFGSTIFDHLLN